MSENLSENEIIHAFVINAKQKIQELNGVATVLMKEGAKPEFFDAIYRASTSIKNFASTCNQNQIVYFIVSVIDAQFNRIRLEKKEITDTEKLEIKENIKTLREMVLKLVNEMPTKETAIVTSDETNENQLELLATIGQLSVWSFHEMMNAFAKVHGYTELLDDIAQHIPKTFTQVHSEMHVVQGKLIANTEYMTGIMNRIRSLRGKTKITLKDFNIRSLVQRIQDLTQQPRKTLQWSALQIPSVNIQVDHIIFEQMWVHLWKLLSEWQTPNKNIQSMCLGKIEKNKNPNNPKYKNQLNLYIWIEPNSDSRINPEALTYTDKTEHTDIANVFHYTAKTAARIQCEASYGKSNEGSPVFKISLACDDILHAISEITGNAVPQPLHLTEENKINAPLKYVLIVDDEKDLRAILSIKISKLGYGVCAASSIQEARDISKQKEIKLILSDLFLNNESGIELMKEFKLNFPTVPFIFITGADEDDIPNSIMEIMMKYTSGFLPKPISNQTLKEILDKNLPLT
ncbi:response regulator [Fluviispira multicolorata]|uniref:Response regulator n=1 Tax=Fluviispira multicolorata TaxID=2654512 RepID=A0A833JBB0_9BACT|nr:response regulator [Fluviispira multicolorata]KAB8027965.1 response regulator [Fluviispira multicolorata]